MELYRIVVGEVGVDVDSERVRLAADLEQRLLTSDAQIVSIRRANERPGETMAAGTIVTLELAGRIGRSLLEALRTWLTSRRTEIELETPEGLKLKISAATFDEATKLLIQVKGGI